MSYSKQTAATKATSSSLGKSSGQQSIIQAQLRQYNESAGQREAKKSLALRNNFLQANSPTNNQKVQQEK